VLRFKVWWDGSRDSACGRGEAVCAIMQWRRGVEWCGLQLLLLLLGLRQVREGS